jgi:hypothetical protein
MTIIKVKYGSEEITKTYDNPPTVSTVLGSASVKAQLGFGDNVRALVNGVEQGNSSVLTDGVTVLIETKANTKAARFVQFIKGLFRKS